MPVPVIGCPGNRPATLDTVLRMGLPETGIRVGVALGVLVIEVIAAPAPGGMPTPDRILPTTGMTEPKKA
jgi:hypothetical protein